MQNFLFIERVLRLFQLHHLAHTKSIPSIITHPITLFISIYIFRLLLLEITIINEHQFKLTALVHTNFVK